MVFGEIVEPSTRALIDEDLDEYPDYTESIPEWEGSSEPPPNIDSLIFIETDRVVSVFQNCVLQTDTPICKINNAGIEVFRVEPNKYVVAFKGTKNFTCGEITELFSEWITKAKSIQTITSDSIYNYQGGNSQDKPVALVKSLSNDETTGYEQLEAPNLVSGLGAGVLTYCIHVGLKCSLFVIYVDTSPSDSLNMGPLLSLVKKLALPLKSTNIKTKPFASNLYM